MNEKNLARLPDSNSDSVEGKVHPDLDSRSKTIRFAHCEVRLEAREILVQGVIQQVAPLTFDVLSYLLCNRHRVVTKDELIEQAWAGRVVSEGVVARVIMKVRQAIGDEVNQQRFIKTFNRRGYRFVGLVEGGRVLPLAASRHADGTSLPVEAVASQAVRVAVLPFINGCDNTQLAWIELGMMGVLVRELKADNDVSVVPVSSVLMAIDQTSEQGLQVRESMLAQLLGASAVIATHVRVEDGIFVAQCSFFRGKLCSVETIESRELHDIPKLIAKALQMTLGIGAVNAGVKKEVSNDPFIQEAWARALEAAHQDRWPLALELFRALMALEPRDVDIKIQHARVLSYLNPGEAKNLAAGILDCEGPRLSASQRFECLECIARCLGANGSTNEAKSAWITALTFAIAHLGDDAVIIAYFGLSLVAINQADLVAAAEYIETAEELCRKNGDHVMLARVLATRGTIEAQDGNLLAARALFEESAVLSKGSKRSVIPLYTENYLATVNAELGYFSKALEIAGANFGRALANTTLAYSIVMAESLCEIAWHCGDGATIRSIIGRLQPRFEGEPDSVACDLGVIHGLLALTTRQHELASQYFVQHLKQLLHDGRSRDFNETIPYLYISQGRMQRACVKGELDPELTSKFDVADAPLAKLMASHCDARCAVQAGVEESAISQLRAAIESTPSCFWRTHAGIDLAWLLAEHGELAGAERFVRSFKPWLLEHPAGMALNARLFYARRDHAEASRIQARLMTKVRYAGDPILVQLLNIYKRPGDSGFGQTLIGNWLPSDLI